MNPEQTDTTAGQSGQGQNNDNSQGQENDHSQIPQSAPANWQHLFSDLQAIVLKQGEELRLLRQQQVPAVVNVPEAPSVSVPVIGQQHGVENRLEPLYERFRKQQPSVFEGSADPIKAEQWMSMLNTILDFMKVVGSERVACAAYMFREDARIWWEVVGQTKDVNLLSWEEFQTLFNEKYYNDAIRAAKADEFMRLLQGSLSVTEYALRFDRLAKFAKELVPTDGTRRERFLQGLQPRLARDVRITTVAGVTTYAQVVEKALTAESAEIKIWRDNAARRDFRRPGSPFVGSGRGVGPSDQKRKVPDTFPVPGSDRRPRGITMGRPGSSEAWKTRPECPKCKKRHLGECRAKACFLCGVVGHLKKDCPQIGKKEPRKVDSSTPARVFTLTQAEAEASPSVVTGQLLSAGTPYHVLIDSGATHSFVASSIIDRLCRPCDFYAVGFGTLLPTGEIVVSRRWVRSLPVTVEGRELSVDLIELVMTDFDMILGMDWLAKYGATIDCRRKMVTFEPEGEDPFVFVGTVHGPRVPMISVLRARDLLQRGCIGFLASVVDTTQVVPVRPEDTRLVCEFLDVFPEDLPGLPPHREIEFVIELVWMIKTWCG
ncbi:uncharacterized protein LOC133830299 [Humulus lupulus]|uniref:uncharacterized protein LOC133830299 n=1 Tax=Humulus lupulus TaxID=3486 RepID=UPI002B415D54|nr:uncharacterized protein LOC133830299 [Humulus lupulus]XP_062116237.1 uncharacterized protein LOC133830299 [Humulus lupulus]